MAAHTKFFIGLTGTALLVVIGAGFYEMDRRGRSQFDDLAARVEEVDSSLSQLRRDLRAETTARTTLRTDVRRDNDCAAGQHAQAPERPNSDSSG